MNNENGEEISLFHIANCIFFAFIIVIAFFWFGQSVKSGFIMLIYAAMCSPFVTKKVIESGKLGKFSKLILFVIHFCLFLIILIAPHALRSKTETIPEPQQQQQIIAEEATIETTEQPTKPPTETEPETIQETTETPTEATTEPRTTIPETEATTEPPTEAKKQVGKDIDKIETFSYRGDVRNDTTGNWRYAVLAEYGVNVAEYAVSYYDKYMSGKEIHAVINLLDGTTTKIVQAIAPDELALTVYSYVDGEEHDAVLMFSGTPLKYYTVNKETGEITEE